MRKFTASFVFVLVFGALAFAQMEPQPLVVPNTELFLGYAFQHADTSGEQPCAGRRCAGQFGERDSVNLNGFAFEFSHYLPSRFGFTIGIARGSNSKVDSTGFSYVRTSYLAGPSYRLRPWRNPYFVGPRARRC